MSVSRMFLATAIFAGLAMPAAAEAAASPSPVKAANAAAHRYWGATPCNGKITIVARSSLVAGMDPTTDAWATFTSSLGANNLAAPAASYSKCAISLARWRWPTAASMSQDWDLLCATVVHETGHLLGKPHDARRGSVMAPVFGERSKPPTVCRTMRPRTARR